MTGVCSRIALQGCAIESVLDAVGLTLTHLHPPRTLNQVCKPERRPFPAADVLRAIGFETLLVSIVAAHLSRGEPLTERDCARLQIAHARISVALKESGHG